MNKKRQQEKETETEAEALKKKPLKNVRPKYATLFSIYV